MSDGIESSDSSMQDSDDEQLAQQLATLIGGKATPDEKHNVHSFLHNVATAPDTTKVGYLGEEELGNMPQTVRSSKELALISNKIMANDFFKDYFEKEAEISTSTSLSKNAKLINLAVVQKRELADTTKKRKINRSWFKKKQPEQEEV